MISNARKNEGGYIVIMSVLIVSAVSLMITLSMFFLGNMAGKTSFSFVQSLGARSLANACAEEALQNIRDDVSFTGYGTLTGAQGTCHLTVVDNGGDSRTINAFGEVGNSTQRVKVNLDVTYPYINVLSWVGVSEF